MATLVVHFVDSDSRLRFLETLGGDQAPYVSESGNFVVLPNASEEVADELRADPLVESVEEDLPLTPFLRGVG